MNISQNNTSHIVSNKVAGLLANAIIKVQVGCSNWLNQKFNGYSTQGKKRLLIAIGLLTSIFLIASSFSSFYTIPKLSQNYSSAHIGMSSDMPKPIINEHQLTDSLTKTK
jgi:hypothetical protein